VRVLLNSKREVINEYRDGERIAGRYEIVGSPMRGGKGLVYACVDLLDNNYPVALKTFRGELLSDLMARNHFLREGTNWIELGCHLNIVRCYRVIYEDPVAFIVMELVAKDDRYDGASLRHRLSYGCSLDLETSLLYIWQIVRGMKFPCSKAPGFVHRDLKPENILIGADKLPGTTINRLRITDFGLARVFENHNDQTIEELEEQNQARNKPTKGIVGTPLYMAPEQWEQRDLGTYTDVYAVGCSLYELLSGEPTAKGKTIKEIKEDHCNEKKKLDLSKYPESISNFVHHCLAKNSKERYSDWLEVEETIRSIYKNTYCKELQEPEDTGEIWHEEKWSGIGWSYNTIGVSYRDIGKAKEAILFHERALQESRTRRDQDLEISSLSSLGNTYIALGEANQAIEYFEKSLKIASDTNDIFQKGVILSGIGIAYYIQGTELQRSINYLEQALAFSRQDGDQYGEGTVLSNLGLIYSAQGNHKRAIGCFEQALSIARKIGNLRLEGMGLGNLGITYRKLKESDESIRYFEQALWNYRTIADRGREGEILVNLGSVYKDRGENLRAISYYEQALKIAIEVADRRGEANSLCYLGLIYSNIGNKSQAIECYKKAVWIYHEIGNLHGEGTTLGNIGVVYYGQGDIKSAIIYYEQALAIQRQIKDNDGIANNAYNIALIYSQSGQVKKAITLLEEVIEIWKQLGYKDDFMEAEKLIKQLKGSSKKLKFW